LRREFPTLSEAKVHFFKLLAARLPTSDPEVLSADGQYVDIMWGDKASATLSDEDTLGISDFTKGEQQYHYYEQLQDAVEPVCKLVAGI